MSAPNMRESRKPHQAQILSNEEFENLKRSLQLLRISQLRYVVQKFSLPANGNKTRLQSIVLGLIDSLRTTALLPQISVEVQQILARQHEPFVNPLDTMKKIAPFAGDSATTVPAHPLVRFMDSPPLGGPVLCPQGASMGSIAISDSPTHNRVALTFEFVGSLPAPFELTADINGFPLLVLSDDPVVAPLDITEFFQGCGTKRAINISCIKAPSPMVLTVKEYAPITISEIASRDGQDPSEVMAKGKACVHAEAFNFASFLSEAYSRGKWVCPICCGPVSLEEIVVCPSQGTKSSNQKATERPSKKAGENGEEWSI